MTKKFLEEQLKDALHRRDFWERSNPDNRLYNEHVRMDEYMKACKDYEELKRQLFIFENRKEIIII